MACYNKSELKNDPNVRNFWCQSLDSMWTNIFEVEGGLGGAIWCMLDETFMLPENMDGSNEWWGIIDKNVSHMNYAGPTVGYGEWGIVDSWRRKKPEFWGTKKAYSPTKIYTKQITDFEPGKALKVAVHNRFDHTNFSELKIKWKYGEQLGELGDVELEPHRKGELVFPANNWNTEEKLQVQFFQNDTFLIDEYKLQIGKRKVELPVCKSGKLELSNVQGKKIIKGNNYALVVDVNTGLIENLKVNEELLIKSGPYLNLNFEEPRMRNAIIETEDYVKSWKCSDFQFNEKDGVVKITAKGQYGNRVNCAYTLLIDAYGLLDISYEVKNMTEDKIIQEAGLKFVVGEKIEKLTWNRNLYFTTYPPNHMGSPVGEIALNEIPQMTYREKPNHNWEMDTKGFYYFGLDEELPYTNIARGLKENIYSYGLHTSKSKVEVLSDAKQACRFDKIDGENTLVINQLWDYNSLGWGNYTKQIKSEGEFCGKVVLHLGD